MLRGALYVPFFCAERVWFATCFFQRIYPISMFFPSLKTSSKLTMKVRGCWTTWAPKPAKTTVVQQANLGLFCVVSGKSLEIFRSLTLYVYTVCIYFYVVSYHVNVYIYILSTHVSFHVDGTVTLKLSHIVFSEFIICFSGVTCRFVNLHRPIGSCWIQVSLQ